VEVLLKKSRYFAPDVLNKCKANMGYASLVVKMPNSVPSVEILTMKNLMLFFAMSVVFPGMPKLT
jgi:hypothetical protein